LPLIPDLDLVTRRVGSDAEPSIPIAFALSTALSARPHPPVSAVLSANDHPERAELSNWWYVPTAGAWYEARGRVPAPPAPITARAESLESRGEVDEEAHEPLGSGARYGAREVDEEADERQSVAIRGNQWQSGEVEEEADERQQRLQTSEVEGGAQHGASDRSDEDSSDGWETVSEDG
jgi:hypothetical protein